MIYKTFRFSQIEKVSDDSLDKIEDVLTTITENEKLKKTKPVKRYVKTLKNLAYILQKKPKNKKRDFSEDPLQKDPTTTINTSEANKFNTSLDRLTRSMGNSTNSSVVED